jgi:hypothetical protein
MEKIKLSPNRYELAYHKILQDMPPWKKKAIEEDIKEKKDNRWVNEFVKQVVELAESDVQIFTTTE